jgi:hypothetical protein
VFLDILELPKIEQNLHKTSHLSSAGQERQPPRIDTSGCTSGFDYGEEGSHWKAMDASRESS